ncbi:histidine phosphatase family protein [Williamsia sterculiae]|uniref:Probable phosphomutase, MSMEG_4193 family n=1 Tax=Williamsia sterculiae TaxID=1344003 RepID=A0A1N7ELS3_9NOCA|nr:histidine phosphatase family protein [Williamsia sterculiae]SIR89012.1 probable phosphomutase, MSMEG_4193 family [Williamsia sterculiae]
MTVILVRHGRSTANTSGVLAGRSEGVQLDEKGAEQAAGLVERLAGVTDLAAIVRSPLLRCAQTVAPLVDAVHVDEIVDDRLAEVDYGEWTGKTIKELVSEPLWRTVQQHPSAAVFPGGEGLAAVQTRAVAAIREYDRKFSAAAGEGRDAVWIACSHGDVIKSVVADAMGCHLDSFQRVVVDPASITVIRYGETRPYVHTVNNTGHRLTVPRPPPAKEAQATAGTDDAVVGGSTGTEPQP